MAKQIPVALVVFDVLWLDGHDTTGLAWRSGVSCWS